jgi:hypothetical protein
MISSDSKRAAPRRRVLKTGHIIFTDKAPKLECIVRSLSSKGVYLEVSTTVGIPPQFDLVVDGVRHSCCAIRRTDNQIGVQFEPKA